MEKNPHSVEVIISNGINKLPINLIHKLLLASKTPFDDFKKLNDDNKDGFIINLFIDLFMNDTLYTSIYNDNDIKKIIKSDKNFLIKIKPYFIDVLKRKKNDSRLLNPDELDKIF